MAQAETTRIPKRIPLITNPANRAETADKDAKLVNCYAERAEDGEYWIYKRPGWSQSSRPPGTNATGFGIYNWLGDIYSIFGSTVYKNGVALVGTVDTNNGLYRFSQCLGATPKLQMGNGLAAYNYDSGAGLVQITDVDFPSHFCKGWAYVDGTTYVMVTTAHIQGSDINDPTSWNALNTILAQIEPDQGVALNKQLVYVVAFKQWSTEVFYDAGNATGSPLGTVPGAKMQYGCATQDSVRDVDGALFWVSTSRQAGVQVAMMEGVKLDIVSTPQVERLLNSANFGTTYSWTLKLDGHKFYVITAALSNITLAYDITQRVWSQWTDSNGNYIPIVDSTYSGTATHYLQHESNGRIYLPSIYTYTDDGAVITVDILPPQFDGGTRRRKQQNLLEVVADQTSGSVLQVRNNDFDYASDKWTQWRILDLGQRRPVLPNCGTYSRRAYQFRHQCDTPLRIKAIEAQIDIGVL